MKNFSTQKDKELLLQDLCSRSCHGVICSIYRVDDWGVGWRDEELTGYWRVGNTFEFYFGETPISIYDDIFKIKPYLRPMSSMTEDERNEIRDYVIIDEYNRVISDNEGIIKYINWLNRKMFDYRGLIPKGLALIAPEGMYKEK